MSDMRELYQEMILDHYRKPRNFGKLEGSAHSADGSNPLCGDKIKVYVELAGDVVKDIRFEGSGCAISTASASMMTEALKGKSIAEADRLFELFHHLVTDAKMDPSAQIGKLAVFSGVREFPMRVKCASLAWHTMQAAVHDEKKIVSTE